MDIEQILIFGPKLKKRLPTLYGGGVGGYITNFKSYLEDITLNSFKFQPCYLSVNGEYNKRFYENTLRIIEDFVKIVSSIYLKRPKIIHIIASYNFAIYRELLIILIAKTISIPVVYDIRGGSFLKGYKCYEKKINPYKICINLANQIICEGKEDVNFLKKATKNNVKWVPNFVPNSFTDNQRSRELPIFTLEEGKLKCSSTKYTINLLYVGAFNSQKGADIILSTLNRLKEDEINFCLLLIGKIDRKFIKELENFNKIRPNSIISYGILSRDEVIKKMDISDIYLYPTSHYGEGQNNTITESMARGLPVIASNKGFIFDLLKDCGIVLRSPASSQDMYEAIKIVLTKKDTYLNFSKNSLKKIKKEYTSYSISSKFNDIYNRLIV